jgi:hypothetical protein
MNGTVDRSIVSIIVIVALRSPPGVSIKRTTALMASLSARRVASITISAVDEVMGPDSSTVITRGVAEASTVSATTWKDTKRITNHRERLGLGFTEPLSPRS